MTKSNYKGGRSRMKEILIVDLKQNNLIIRGGVNSKYKYIGDGVRTSSNLPILVLMEKP